MLYNNTFFNAVLHLQPVVATGLHRDTNSDRQKRGHAKTADAHKSHITCGVRRGLLGLCRPLLVSARWTDHLSTVCGDSPAVLLMGDQLILCIAHHVDYLVLKCFSNLHISHVTWFWNIFKTKISKYSKYIFRHTLLLLNVTFSLKQIQYNMKKKIMCL